MSAKVFVDTNIFLYAILEDNSEQIKRQKAIAFLQKYSGQIVISTQVLNEFYSAMLKNGVSDQKIQEKTLEIIAETKVSTISTKTIIFSWLLKMKYRFSLWDSLIVAVAHESGCELLFSEDMQHNLLVEGKLRIINPFLK